MYIRRTIGWILVIPVASLMMVSTVRSVRHRQKLNFDSKLIAAIKKSDADQVEALLAAGADANARDRTAYIESPRQQFRHFVHPLPPEDFEPAIVVAVNHHQPRFRIIKALIGRGADVNARYCYMGTALNMVPYYDSRANPAEIAEILLMAGAKADVRGADNETPLINAARYKRPAVLTLLLDHHADPTAASMWGNTPLLNASMTHNTANVQVLLDRGALSDGVGSNIADQSAANRIVSEADSQNYKHQNGIDQRAALATPLSIAQRERYADIVTLLKRHGAKR